MNKILLYSFIMVFSVFISSVSQIILKKSALRPYNNILKEYLNPYVIIAYMFFFLSTFITIFALKYVPLSVAPIIESTGYIFILVLGKIVLKEQISNRKLLGVFVILLGIYIFTK